MWMPQHPRRIDQITPGCYRYRRVKGGPWMPAVVTLEGDMVYVVEADDKLRVGISAASYEDLVVNAVMEGAAFDSPLLRVLWFGEPISEREHDRLMGVLYWARIHQPTHPMLHPDTPINLAAVQVATIF